MALPELVLVLVFVVLVVVAALVSDASGLGRGRGATVATAVFRDGDLPGVCAVTGEDADDWWEVQAKSPIGAQWLLLLLGLVPFVLVRALTVKRTRGFLPVARVACAERPRPPARPT